MEISFSYIITFISLIYGLALAHSLSCIAEYIQHWKQIKHYWVWWFWAIFLILLFITMLVAINTHLTGGDGIMGASHAIESAVVFLCLFFSGAGNYSVHLGDTIIEKERLYNS